MPLDGLSPTETRAVSRTAAEPRLGEILIAQGAISARQLEAALSRTTATGRRIGEELVAEGLLSPERVARALRLQRRVILAALLGAVFGQAQAAETRAYMSVTANVVDTVGIRAVHQAQDLVISAEDIARGFVEVADASLLEVRNSRPSLFEFRAVGRLFRAVTVSGASGTAQFGAQGGSLLAKPDGGGLSRVALTYRFELGPDVAPGIHRWPLALTVLPL